MIHSRVQAVSDPIECSFVEDRTGNSISQVREDCGAIRITYDLFRVSRCLPCLLNCLLMFFILIDNTQRVSGRPRFAALR
jgi:hypothetical protein